MAEKLFFDETLLESEKKLAVGKSYISEIEKGLAAAQTILAITETDLKNSAELKKKLNEAETTFGSLDKEVKDALARSGVDEKVKQAKVAIDVTDYLDLDIVS